MASMNHINYWNYLESVTANRNREYENTRHNKVAEGIDIAQTQSNISLNASQELVNEAQKLKVLADTEVSYAQVDKIAADTIVSKTTVDKLLQDIEASKANVNYQKGSLALDAKELQFEIGKFAKQYILDEKDVATRAGNLALGAAKLKQELSIFDKKQIQEMKMFVDKQAQDLTMHNDKILEIKGDRAAEYAKQQNDANISADRNQMDLTRALIGLIDFF